MTKTFEVCTSLQNLRRGAKLFLKNNEEVLFIKKHGLRLTVLGSKGLKNISYHQISIDLMADYYCDEYLYAG